MNETSVPVDLFNPGQVFACLGFMEAAEILFGEVEGRFDWRDPSDTRFVMRGNFEKNPFEVVLNCLASSEIKEIFPKGWAENVLDQHEEYPSPLNLHVDEKRKPSTTKLPGRLDLKGHVDSLPLNSWTDGSSRPEFKLYSGNRSGCSIAQDMLVGKRAKPKKNQTVGDLTNEGVTQLLKNDKNELVKDPFNRLVNMAGSFNMDPRGAWNAMDAGYSPNTHGHAVLASPVVEFMACFSLQNMRPCPEERNYYDYSVWDRFIPVILARAVCSATPSHFCTRNFRFLLALSGKNKIITFAEEINPTV
ncbi:MAG: hypothetical protein WD490_01990 [Opitutales bacterium]